MSYYPKASSGLRFGAYLLDGLIAFGLAIPGVLFIVFGAIQLDNGYYSGIGAALLILGILLCFAPIVYAFIKDGLGRGQSWGKKAVGLMVVHLSTNTPCSKGSSSLRCLIGGLLEIIPYVGWLIEPIMVLATQDGRRLADKVADTQVIETYNYHG